MGVNKLTPVGSQKAQQYSLSLVTQWLYKEKREWQCQPCEKTYHVEKLFPGFSISFENMVAKIPL